MKKQIHLWTTLSLTTETLEKVAMQLLCKTRSLVYHVVTVFRTVITLSNLWPMYYFFEKELRKVLGCSLLVVK